MQNDHIPKSSFPTTPADVVPDAPTIAEHDAEAVGTYVLEVRAAPGATLEATVDELATNATKAGPLILELTCDGAEELGCFELPDGAVAARVYIDAGAKPAELEPFPGRVIGLIIAGLTAAEIALYMLVKGAQQ